MWIDHHALFKPITKATLRLERGCVAETVTHAIALALTEPKGPVHLDLPEDVALAATNERVASPAQPGKLAPAPDAALARAGELLAASEPPISSSVSAMTRSRWNMKPGSAKGRCCRSISSRWTSRPRSTSCIR